MQLERVKDVTRLNHAHKKEQQYIHWQLVLTPWQIRATGIMVIGISLPDPAVFQAGPGQSSRATKFFSDSNRQVEAFQNTSPSVRRIASSH